MVIRLLQVRTHEFNSAVCSAIEDTIRECLGEWALYDSLFTLETQYDISRDELPYRIDTLYRILETKHQVVGANTMAPLIAQKMYRKLGLSFYPNDGYTLRDYVKDAKLKLAKQPSN